MGTIPACGKVILAGSDVTADAAQAAVVLGAAYVLAAPYSLPLRAAARTREVLNNEIRWYFDFNRGWMDRSASIGYVLRATSPGAFESGVTRIEDFYDQAQVSLGPSARFNIDPAH